LRKITLRWPKRSAANTGSGERRSGTQAAARRNGAAYDPPLGRKWLQACMAAWNCGELLSAGKVLPRGPMPIAMTPPDVLMSCGRGSGKFVIPWARMHVAVFRPWLSSPCCCAGLNWKLMPACRYWQAARAEENSAELRLIPLVLMVPLLAGSGNSGTPCERMQCAYSSAP
jgi:hypothetical protein